MGGLWYHWYHIGDCLDIVAKSFTMLFGWALSRSSDRTSMHSIVIWHCTIIALHYRIALSYYSIIAYPAHFSLQKYNLSDPWTIFSFSFLVPYTYRFLPFSPIDNFRLMIRRPFEYKTRPEQGNKSPSKKYHRQR